MEQLQGLAQWAMYVVGSLFVGLPLLAAVCFAQTVVTRKRGDEALARSWADATRSFVSMTLGSWLLALMGNWGYSWLIARLANLRAH